MKQDFAFIAQRALAQHSPALVRPAPPDTAPAQAELLAALGQVTPRLARGLHRPLARLCGDAITIAIAPPHAISWADFAAPGLCAYSLYSAGADRLRAPGHQP